MILFSLKGVDVKAPSANKAASQLGCQMIIEFLVNGCCLLGQLTMNLSVCLEGLVIISSRIAGLESSFLKEHTGGRRARPLALWALDRSDTFPTRYWRAQDTSAWIGILSSTDSGLSARKEANVHNS